MKKILAPSSDLYNNPARAVFIKMTFNALCSIFAPPPFPGSIFCVNKNGVNDHADGYYNPCP
jgi:hypothetical protein